MIVAFSGYSYAGKSTAANYLASKYGFTVKSFAEPLKELARQFFPFTNEELYGKLKDKPYQKFSWTPREFVINLGGMIRYHSPDYFLKDVLKAKGDIAIDDLRFLNEADYVRSKGAKIVRLERYAKYLNPNAKGLPSETALDNYKFDLVIHPVQNTDIKSLQNTLDKVIEDFKS